MNIDFVNGIQWRLLATWVNRKDKRHRFLPVYEFVTDDKLRPCKRRRSVKRSELSVEPPGTGYGAFLESPRRIDRLRWHGI